MIERVNANGYDQNRARMMLRLRKLPDSDEYVHRAPLVAGAWTLTLARIGHPLSHAAKAQLTAVGVGLLARDWPAGVTLVDAVTALLDDQIFRVETARGAADYCGLHGAGWISEAIEAALADPAAP